MEFGELLQSDVDYIKVHGISRGFFKQIPEQSEWNYSLRHEGKTLAIGGMSLITMTTAWVWVAMSDDAKSQIYTVYRVISEWMMELVTLHNLKRLQAYTEFDFAEADLLVEHLGFKLESVMDSFIDDKPAKLWVRIF